MFAFMNDILENKVYKGIKKSNMEKTKLKIYKNCLVESEQTREKVYSIVSKQYHLYTVELDKISLSPYNDERYLVDNINTRPCGYYLCCINSIYYQ